MSEVSPDNNSLSYSAKGTILRGISADLISSFILFFVNLLVAAQCINIFGSGYGSWLAVYSMMSMIGFFELGVSQFFIRDYCTQKNNEMRDRHLGELLSLVLVTTFIIGVCVFIIGIIFVDYVIRITNTLDVTSNFILALRYYALYAGLSIPLAIFKQLLVATQKAGTYGIVGMVDGLFNGILTIALLEYYPFYTTIIYCLFCSLFFTTSLAFLLLPQNTFKPLRRPSLSLLCGMFQYCKSIFTARICFIVREKTDQPIIAHFIGAEAVVVYMATQRLIRVPLTILGSLTSSAFAPLAKLHSTSSSIEFSRFFFRMISVVVLGSIAATISCILFNEYFISLWLGRQYYGGILLSIIMALWLPADAISRGFGSVLWAINYTKPLIRSHFLEAILNFIFSIFLASYLGLIGVALGTLLSSILSTIWMVPHAVLQHLDKIGWAVLSETCSKYVIYLLTFIIFASVIALALPHFIFIQI